MSNNKPARPAVTPAAPKAEAPAAAPEVGLGVTNIENTVVTSNDDAPRSRTVVESNDEVQAEVRPEIDAEERDFNGTVITTFIGLQPGVPFAAPEAAEVVAADKTAAAIAAFAEQD